MIEQEEPELLDLNPSYGTVIGFVDGDGELQPEPNEAQFDLLINVGQLNDVTIDERVLIFALGDEISDPETGESLGHFEIVRGEGKIVSVQARMSIVRSSRTSSERVPKTRTAFQAASGLPIEFTTRNIKMPFRKPERGDLVRFI